MSPAASDRPDPSEPSGEPAPKGLLGWAASHRKQSLILIAACLVSVVSGAGLWSFWLRSAGNNPPTLKGALAALDGGDYAGARRLADELSLFEPNDKSGPAYVLAAAAAYEAEESGEGNWLSIAAALRAAHDLGVPEGREAEALFLLGKSLALAGRYTESRPVLREALAADPSRGTAVHGLLAMGYLAEPNPKYAEALEENSLYLADERLESAQRHNALVQRAHILARLGKTAEARELATELVQQSDDPAAALTAAEISLVEAGAEAVPASRRSKYDQCLRELEQWRRTTSEDEQAQRVFDYLASMALEGLGEDGKAMECLKRVGTTTPRGAEHVAADLRWSELAQRLNHQSEAAAACCRALADIVDPDHFSNPWLSLDEVRRRVEALYGRFMQRGALAEAAAVAAAAGTVCGPAQAVELEAEAHRQWGTRLTDTSSHTPGSEGRRQLTEGRRQWRLAARAYQRLAALRITTRHYADDLWSAAEAYLAGHGYREAVTVLNLYLENESRRRRPRALVNLGEALLNLGETEKALTVLEECVEFYNTDAAAYQARLLASAAHAEKGEIAEAEALLGENLNGALTPQSQEWRQSLFGLGFLLADEGRDEEAVRRLAEAVERYPDARESPQALYRIGQIRFRGAQAVLTKTRGEPIEADRIAGAKQADLLLTQAIDRFRQAQQTLSLRQETAELDDLERKTQRNCYFAAAAALSECGRYEEAVRAYAAAASRYQNYPESLEAYAGMARAYQRLNQPERARMTVEQAKVLWARLKAGGSLTTTTLHDAPQWAASLEDLARFDDIPTVPSP